MLNELIKSAADANLYGMIYDLIGTSAYIIAIIFVVWYGKKIGISSKMVILSTLIVFLCSNLSMMTFIWIKAGFKDFGRGNAVALFVYVPLYCILFFRKMNVPLRVMWDYTIYVPLISHAIGRWGCVFMGCCRGVPNEWGIYNLRTDGVVFPVQIIESIVAFVIWGVVLYRSKKRKYKADGYNVPVVLIAYGISRFFLEYFHDNSKYIFGWSKMTFQSVMIVIIGIAAWKKLKKEEKITSMVDES